VEIEHDILDLIRDLPDGINDASTTTEFKFLTVGSVLWECRAEIIRLREEVEQLKNGKVRTRAPKNSYLRRVQKDIR
jgi:hypothetical protein